MSVEHYATDRGSTVEVSGAQLLRRKIEELSTI